MTLTSKTSPVTSPAPAGRLAQSRGTNPVLKLVSRIIDWPMAGLQRLIGERRMPYVFLLPNLVFFGLFVFVPIGINFVYSVTGGPALFPSERPYVGADQYAYLFDCGSYARSDHLPRGPFLARRLQHARSSSLFQVCVMVLFSLLTALVLNMKIRGRGFFRAVYFFPGPAVAGRRGADLEVDPAARRPAQRRASPRFGGQKILFFVDPGWAFFWAIFVSIWAHMGFYTLILLAGLQAIPRISTRPPRWMRRPAGGCSGASPCRC